MSNHYEVKEEYYDDHPAPLYFVVGPGLNYSQQYAPRHLTFKDKEDAEKVVEFCNKAFLAGKQELRMQLRDLLGVDRVKYG